MLMLRVRNLWFIIMTILLVYFMIKELLALNYSKLNAFILIHCGLYIIYLFYNMFQYI